MSHQDWKNEKEYKESPGLDGSVESEVNKEGSMYFDKTTFLPEIYSLNPGDPGQVTYPLLPNLHYL